MGFPLGKPAKPRPPHQRRSAGNDEHRTGDDDENDHQWKQELRGAAVKGSDQHKQRADQPRATEQRDHDRQAIAALPYAGRHERELVLRRLGHVEAHVLATHVRLRRG